MEADAVEIRVLGCLLEKQRTTPDAYPLSLNALRVACNQATNRDPVVEYDEATVVEALRRLALRGWTRLASGPSSRARKYRHLLKDALGLGDAELSLLAILMLRGTQTPGELKQRAGRLHAFADLSAVEETLDRLIGAGHVARLGRRPGQKEERYAQLLGGGEDAVSSAMTAPAQAAAEQAEEPAASAELERPTATPDPAGAKPSRPAPPAEDRLEWLEDELAELRQQVRDLREALGEDDTGQA